MAAIDARKGARKHNNHPTILSRWQNDEQHRTSSNRITGRPWTPQEEPTNVAKILSQSGGKRMRSTEIRS